MSDSRLEKFIYAICSMDVSDLPVPLSRIEKLWNCLITGETPDFEPLSRNEKYLMAMLDRYDISNLPAPMSRGEKLLYKIAMGETDLSDVPGYLSRYEELLKYLIENGGISGGDFEYVLYTLNQSLSTLYATAEKPVKSAILKGQTLVNLSSATNESWRSNSVNAVTKYFNIVGTEVGKTYTIIVLDYPNKVKKFRLSEDNGVNRQFEPQTIKKITFNSTITDKKMYLYLYSDDGVELNVNEVNDVKLMILEGDYTNVDIPYFTGMQSVKMPVLKTTGKNLLNISPDALERVTISGKTGEITKSTTRCTTEYIKATPNDDLFLKRIDSNYKVAVRYYHDDKLVNRELNLTGSFINDGNIRVDYNEYYNQIRLIFAKNDDSEVTPQEVSSQQIMLTSSRDDVFEPYKSNILTVNEEVELRGIGDVKDELDCLTGEVTQRIGEYSLDGSSNNGEWVIRTDIYMEGYIYFQQELNYILQSKNIAICDLLPYSNQYNISSEQLRLSVYNNETRIGVRLSESKGISSLDEFSEYLKSNPIKFKYPLATASIKTVDLTVVDQDNQPAKLGTFENVTHVSLVAENLIPEVEMEVATRISTELASASPLMDDISTNQQQLEATIDEQSENVDATMIATTEIFEETL